MQLRSIGVAVLAATVLLVAAPPEAGAMTFGSAREELTRSGLSPQPLFPDRVPAKLARADVTLTIADSEQGMGDNDYAVDFFLAHAYRGDPRIVGFRRFPRASLREALRGWRAKRNPFKLVRHAGRLRYAYRGDISFGYAWVQDGKAYFASSKYYGGFTWPDLARLVSSLRHLPAATTSCAASLRLECPPTCSKCRFRLTEPSSSCLTRWTPLRPARCGHAQQRRGSLRRMR